MKDGDTLIALADLCGVAEVSEIIGRSKGRVDQLLLEDRSFPRPVWTLKLGRIWDRAEVVAWVQATGYGEDTEVKVPVEVKPKPVPKPKPVVVQLSDSERASRLDVLLRG